MLAILGVNEGDKLYVTPSDDNGLKIHAYDAAVLEALAEAYVVMNENHILLWELSWR